MIERNNALQLVRRIGSSTERKARELYEGRLFGEPVTIKYSQIRNITSVRENWKLLSENLAPLDGVIVFKGYRPELISNCEYLVTVFESYRGTVETVTKEGRRWTEAKLIHVLIDLTHAAALLKEAKSSNFCKLCPRKLLVTEEGKVKFPLLKASWKDKALREFMGRDMNWDGGRCPQYALGATVLCMALGGADFTVPWRDRLDEIRNSFPVLASILERFLLHECYEFDYLRRVLLLGHCFSLVRLNALIADRKVRTHENEVRLLVANLEQTQRIVGTVATETTRRQWECRSCLTTLELSPNCYVFQCDCGAFNVKS